MPLDREQWRRAEKLFAEAADCDPAERERLLEREPDEEVRREVQSMLRHDAGSTDAIAGAIQEAAADATGGPPMRERIGPYKVLKLLGRGGMGAVYLAARDDDEFSKQVAIKVVPGGVESDELLSRFRGERQILASLEHPHIARLLDGGATEDGLPYLVMDYVDGVPVDVYCDRNRLSLDARLELFREICKAVQHAHRNLIVHRDIKPANILVTADGDPKLLDFGIAKLLEADPDPTAGSPPTATRLMTPEYASPEQIRGERVTTATDVYSLGLLLYELLTGRRPYALQKSGFDAMARAITGQEPERPSTAVVRDPVKTDPGGAEATVERIARQRSSLPDALRRRLAGDLDHILLMALRKEPARRYPTVEQLSEDIRRHLEGLPVEARPDTWGYRAKKYLRRHPWRSVAAALILLLITGSSLGFRFQARQIALERDRAQVEADTAKRVTDFMVELFEYSSPQEARGREIPVVEVLERGARRVQAELADDAEIQARLMTTIAEVYGNLHRYSDALPLAEAALERQRELHGAESAEAAAALGHVGALRMLLGEEDAAESLLVDSLEMRRRLLGPAHDEIVDGMNTLSMLRLRHARYEEAEELNRAAMAMATELHGEVDERVGTSANALGRVLHAMGEYEEAEAVFRKSLAVRREILGNDHPAVATVLHNLGELLTTLGRFKEGEEVKSEAVELMGRLHGKESVPYALALNNLAAQLKMMGQPERSEPLARESRQIVLDRLGEEHPLSLVGLNNLANVLHDLGELDEAEALHRESLELHRRLRGERHPLTAGAMNNLAALLNDKKEYDEAEVLYRKTIEVDIESVGPDHEYVAMGYSNVAILLRDRGRVEDREEAERLFRKATAMVRASLGDSHPKVAGNEVQYGLFLLQIGRLDDAEKHILGARRITERPDMEGHFLVGETSSILGEYYTVRGEHAKAEPLLLDGYKALHEELGPRSARTRRALARVVAFYEATGQPDKAEEFRALGPPR